MAKKKTSEDTSVRPAPARRRAPAKKLATASDTSSTPGNGAPEPTQAEIAEAAYYRHLNRSGGGDEFTDWIEAERELRERR